MNPSLVRRGGIQLYNIAIEEHAPPHLALSRDIPLFPLQLSAPDRFYGILVREYVTV